MTLPLLGVVSLVEVGIGSIIAFTACGILAVLVVAVLVWGVRVLLREIGKVRRRRH